MDVLLIIHLLYSCGQPKTESFAEADPLTFRFQSPDFRTRLASEIQKNHFLKSCDQYLPTPKIWANFLKLLEPQEALGGPPGYGLIIYT